jgi:CheY-like chemotaxis protein
MERPINQPHQNQRVSAAKPSKALILLVDDDIDLRGILHRFLERSGFSVATAGNGREALERLEIQRVDLLLTDLMMPEISGIELIQTVRLRNLSIPIIAMSADADLRNDGSLELAALAGAQVVLEKPFAMNRLIRELQRLLAAPEIP